MGGPTWDQCVQALRDGGRAVTLVPGDLSGRPGVELSHFSSDVTADRLAEAARLIAEGSVRVEIEERIPLDEAAHAHEILESGHMRGKLVLIPG